MGNGVVSVRQERVSRKTQEAPDSQVPTSHRDRATPQAIQLGIPPEFLRGDLIHCNSSKAALACR